MQTIVWLPEETPQADRERIAEVATSHVYPATGRVDVSLGQGDLLVAGNDPQRALQVAPHIDGLRYLQTFSAGVDKLIGHLPAGVVLCDAAGVHDIAVAEWVLMAILAANRRLPEHIAAQLRGTWRDDRLTGDDLDGANVLLVGAGSIGRAVEARLTAFGPQIVRVARRAREGVHAIADLPRLLPDADIVVILVPHTPETRHLFDAVAIGAMRPGAVLVNA